VPTRSAPPVRIQPFSVAVDTAVIDDLRARICGTRLPEAAPGEPWAQGTDRDWLEELLGYWADGFDWRVAERELTVSHTTGRRSAAPWFISCTSGPGMARGSRWS